MQPHDNHDSIRRDTLSEMDEAGISTPLIMSTPQAKRRRLNTAAKTLHKPFKSPFRTPLKSGPSDTPSSDPSDILTPHTTQVPVVVSAEPEPQQPKLTPRLSSRLRPTSTPIRTLTQRKDPVIVAPKSSPSLTREIITLRSDIQILSQALTLSTSPKGDNDLAVLVDRWRIASRAAAEELFAGTRDRVNRMGGVGAWKSREREGRERRVAWEKEDRDAEKERMMEQREELHVAEGEGEGGIYEDYGDEGEVQKEANENVGGYDDDSFTMDMMLKTLNIDLKLIGYDKEGQRWVG